MVPTKVLNITLLFFVWSALSFKPSLAQDESIACDELRKFSPRTFPLISLARSTSSVVTIDFACSRESELHNWIKDKDVADLAAWINVNTKSASVRASYSAFINSGRSTVGHEAAFLIYGHIKNRYPPMPSSEMISDVDLQKLVKGWLKKQKLGTNSVAR